MKRPVLALVVWTLDQQRAVFLADGALARQVAGTGEQPLVVGLDPGGREPAAVEQRSALHHLSKPLHTRAVGAAQVGDGGVSVRRREREQRVVRQGLAIDDLAADEAAQRHAIAVMLARQDLGVGHEREHPADVGRW